MTDSIVRLVGEGMDRPDAQIPLDINYAKIAEWLVSRQKLPKDWHKRLQAIQDKAMEAVKGLPADLLSSLSGGSDAPLDYFRAVDIRNKLLPTAERTMFGGLTGSAGVWDNIVKAYEKQYVYLGEAGQTIAQCVDFDIPYLRKQMAKHNQQIIDCDRKEVDYTKNAAQCAASYKEECKKLGITGHAVRAELRQLADGLPPMLLQVVEALHDPQLQGACEYYATLTRFAHEQGHGQGGSSAAAAPQRQQQPLLPTLAEVMAGTTAPPAATAADGAAAADQAAAAVAPIGINWDLDMLAGGAAADQDPTAAAGGSGGGGIQWDVEVEVPDAGASTSIDAAAHDAAAAAGTKPLDVDWGIDMTGTGAEAGTGPSTAAAIGINWDIDVQAGGQEPEAHGAEGGVSVAGGGGGCSMAASALPQTPDGTAALRIERDTEYRSRLLDDLQELRGFLLQRKLEMGGRGGELFSTVLPDAVATIDGSNVAAMLSAVTAALTQLTAPRLRQLLLIATSQRYLDRMEANLQRRAGQESKMQRAIRDVQARRNEARSQLVVLAPRVQELVERVRCIKGRVEGAIGSIFAGRRVNILGEINNALSQ